MEKHRLQESSPLQEHNDSKKANSSVLKETYSPIQPLNSNELQGTLNDLPIANKEDNSKPHAIPLQEALSDNSSSDAKESKTLESLDSLPIAITEDNSKPHAIPSQEALDDDSSSDEEESKVLKRIPRDISQKRPRPPRNRNPQSRRNRFGGNGSPRQRNGDRNNRRDPDFQGNSQPMDYDNTGSLNPENRSFNSQSQESEAVAASEKIQTIPNEVPATSSPDVLADFASSKLPPNFWNSFLSNYNTDNRDKSSLDAGNFYSHY